MGSTQSLPAKEGGKEEEGRKMCRLSSEWETWLIKLITQRQITRSNRRRTHVVDDTRNEMQLEMHSNYPPAAGETA